MQSMPSILGGARPPPSASNPNSGTHKEAALRKRLGHEAVLQEAATMARAKAFWKKSYDDAAVALPLSAAATKSFPAPPGTGAVYAPVALSDDWSKLGLCDVRRDRLLFAAHTCAAVLHAIFMITALVITLQSDSPYLQTWRQQFLFVRNTTTCGRNSLFNETGEDEVVAVLIPAGRIHVGLASAAFFMLSCLFSCIWVLASTYDPLGRVLLGWLADAYAPLRWLEYSASASLQVTVLLLISGGRSQVEIACVFVLMAVTMACGYLTEVISRPDPNSDGARWKGDLPDGSNKFRNYVWRMQAHVLGFIPYFTAWSVLFYLYQNTLDDIESAFGDRVADEVPAYIYTALLSTFIVFSSFTICQIIYQWRPPSRYHETELVYALLSFSSKAILGGILMANLLNQNNAEDGSAG